MVSAFPRNESGRTAGGAVARLRARPWYYAYLVLALWGLAPELRRIIDWKAGFSSISLISILPLLSLLPAAYLVFAPSRAARIPRPLVTAAWLWTGAFSYAYAIGVAAGNAAPATYTLLAFMLPMFFGLFVATLDVPPAVLYERIAGFALALSVPISLYTVYQFVAPPPWDLYWIQQTAYVSVGKAAAFQFRPFGTLNGPGAFGDYIFGVVALNLPRLRGRNPLRLAAIAADLIALAVSLDRANWIALVLAAIVFVSLSPRKLQNLSLIALIGVVLAFVAANASSLLGNSEAAANLQARFGSLTQISTDSSYIDRQRLFGEALSAAIAQPVGQGLGVLGTAAKLSAGAATVDFDNGYIARLTELGYFGFVVYLATIVFTIAVALHRWRILDATGDRASADIAAAAVAVMAGLIFLDVSSDHHNQFAGILFWLPLAILFARGGNVTALERVLER